MAKNQQKPDAKQQAMRPMTIRQFVKNAEQVVAQTKGNMAMKIANGSIPNMEQYHRSCGRMEGLDQCIGLLKDMISAIEDAQNSDDLPEMTG